MSEFEQIVRGGVTTAAGFTAGAAASGIKVQGVADMALVASAADCIAAGLFTRNRFPAAPVILDRETLAANATTLRAVVANSGNANACTGAYGLANAREMQRQAAKALGCHAEQVLVLSTGVIGVQLPMDRIAAGIAACAHSLDNAHGPEAAKAIMTTDTRPKEIAVRVPLSAGAVIIGGMAKGSGMIHPDMATMLAVITTDARVEPGRLDVMLRTATEQSFNRITVDGDTSTNDTVLLLANGAAGVEAADEADEALLAAALNYVCRRLAHMIVLDGEGATKFVEMTVSGAADDGDAHRVANAMATSPLVKTAFAGSDANWGRLLAAAGRAGVELDPGRVNLWIAAEGADALQLVAGGVPTGYEESAAATIFSQASFKIEVDLGLGEAAVTVWTSDLSEEYVRINADYRS